MAGHDNNERQVAMTARNTVSMTHQPEPRDGVTGSGQFGMATDIAIAAVAGGGGGYAVVRYGGAYLRDVIVNGQTERGKTQRSAHEVEKARLAETGKTERKRIEYGRDQPGDGKSDSK